MADKAQEQLAESLADEGHYLSARVAVLPGGPEALAKARQVLQARQEAKILALTVKQPWAHMIAHGGKAIENRTWSTRYRGLVAVHAGAYSGWDKAAEDFPPAVQAWRRLMTVPASGALAAPFTREAFQYLRFGAVIAVAELAGCHKVCAGTRSGGTCSPWAALGAWHWELADVRVLAEPVPWRGKLGLWELPDGAARLVREQLEASRG